jgi:hypothetical protein
MRARRRFSFSVFLARAQAAEQVFWVAVLVEKTLPQIAQLKLSGTRAARAARQQAEAMALRLGASS